jgi:hypothetical protein
VVREISAHSHHKHPTTHNAIAFAQVRTVALTGASSEQKTLFSRLAASQPALMATSTDYRQGPPVRQRQTQRRLTAEQVQLLVADYKAGTSMKKLTARWDLHRTTGRSCARLVSSSAGRAYQAPC